MGYLKDTCPEIVVCRISFMLQFARIDVRNHDVSTGVKKCTRLVDLSESETALELESQEIRRYFTLMEIAIK